MKGRPFRRRQAWPTLVRERACRYVFHGHVRRHAGQRYVPHHVVLLRALIAVTLGSLVLQLTQVPGAVPDTNEGFRIAFAVGNGEKITVEPSGPTNCTKDESSASSSTGSNLVRLTLKMVAKSSGSCGYESSYETWKVTVQGRYIDGSGNIEFSQDEPGHHFAASCEGKWSGLSCQTLSKFHVLNLAQDDAEVGEMPSCRVTAGSRCRVVVYPYSEYIRGDWQLSWAGSTTVNPDFSRTRGATPCSRTLARESAPGSIRPSVSTRGVATSSPDGPTRTSPADSGFEVRMSRGPDPCVLQVSGPRSKRQRGHIRTNGDLSLRRNSHPPLPGP